MHPYHLSLTIKELKACCFIFYVVLFHPIFMIVVIAYSVNINTFFCDIDLISIQISGLHFDLIKDFVGF